MRTATTACMLLLVAAGCSGSGSGSGNGDSTGDGDVVADRSGESVCTPECEGKVCGPDGCGGGCGECSDDQLCEDYQCIPSWECYKRSHCSPYVCGEDGMCENCTSGASCDEGFCDEARGKCVDCLVDEHCPPGTQCLDHSCVGVSTMSCAEAFVECSNQCPYLTPRACQSAECVAECDNFPPQVQQDLAALVYCLEDLCGEEYWCGENCGPEGGGDGPCSYEYSVCILGCAPDCDGKECGNDGCGGSCGSCQGGMTCQDGTCEEGGAEGTWLDATSGLTWQVSPPTDSYDWDEAKSYCDSLSLGGYSDWYLPTIGELRSLIRGCPGTITGGACEVTDSCLSSDCWDEGACWSCSYGDGPGDEGMYWPDEVEGDCCWYWSSSPVEDDDSFAWNVLFYNGRVLHYLVYDAIHVRCVR